MARFAALLALLSLTGCAGYFEETRAKALLTAPPVTPVDVAYCRSLDSQHRTWGGLAKGSAIASAGLSAGLIPDQSKELRIGLAAGAIGTAAFAGTSVFVSEDASSSYVRDCTR